MQPCANSVHRMWESGDVDRLGVDVATDQAHACPRCEASVVERFYGPCASCRRELRDQQAGAQHALESVAYEPKMNVTPNAVATKD